MSPKTYVGLVLLASTFLVGTASGQTVTVTTTADVIDINNSTGTIADLPGPDGLVSFSEAMIATNNTPGHQTVGFAIPASQLGWCCAQYNGIAVFHSNVGFYWRANDEVTIDGTTQTAFAGNTNPDGAEVLLYGKTFYLNDDNSTLRGFHGTAVQSGGVNSLIEDNTGGMNLTLFGGGGSTVRNNDCGTIKIDRSNDNVLIGNTTNRVRVWGFGAGQAATNNRIGGPALAHRNYIIGYGSYNSEGLPSGTAVQLFATDGTIVENNWIGTADGLTQGNLACTVGVGLETHNQNVLIKDNLISGILGHGAGPHHAGQLFGRAILASGSGSALAIVDNVIGPDINGDPVLGSVQGLDFGDPVTHPLTMTGIAVAGNEIAGHIFNGVTVGRNTAAVRLTGNSIHDNGWLGIDLIPTGYGYGVTPNDPLDADTGGNGLQNFPDLASATLQGAAIHLLGTLHSSPLDDFTVEVFASPACDPSGFGQGRLFLGATSVSTDASGNAALDFVVSATAPQGWVVSATATLEPLGATSEFSACVPLGGAVGTVFCTGDPGTSGVPCPCGNNSAAAAQAGCLNSTGSGALLRGSGTVSVAADDLVLSAAQMPAASSGVLFMGPGASLPVPFGDGLRCIGAPLYRYAPQISGSGGAFAYGPGLIAYGLANLPPAGWITPGSTWRFQTWYRDPVGTCGSGYNLSNGLEVSFTP